MSDWARESMSAWLFTAVRRWKEQRTIQEGSRPFIQWASATKPWIADESAGHSAAGEGLPQKAGFAESGVINEAVGLQSFMTADCFWR